MSPLTPLTIRSDLLIAEILPRGASVTAIRTGNDAPNLILGLTDPARHVATPGCLGAIVGPVANRIAAGRVTLGDRTWQMPLNEGGRNTLHSGPEGLHLRDWQVIAQTGTELTLGIELAHGAHGLPGNRRITTTYRISDRTLDVDIRATTDQPTPMNIAWHPYWTLGHGGDVSGLRLSLASEHYLPVDVHNIPTGEIRPVTDTAFDFRKARPVPCAPELDVNFCLARADRTAPQPALVLQAPDGTRLDVETTAPGLQVYAGAHLPQAEGVLSDGGDLGPYAGLALEPQFWPDAPNQPDFPQITLQPGHEWRQISRYSITTPP